MMLRRMRRALARVVRALALTPGSAPLQMLKLVVVVVIWALPRIQFRVR